MTALSSDAVLTVFVIFCRIGSCLMLMPGFSSQRIPANVRLLISFSATLTLTPLLAGEIKGHLSGRDPAIIIVLFISEIMTGFLIGFLARIFFGALETLAGAIAMSIGLTSALAGPIDENESLPAISTLITLSAAVLIFLTDLHWEVLRGLCASYSALPVSGWFDARVDLVQVTDCLTKSFFISLRVSSPFIVYALIVNFVIGLAGKLIPQIPVYFMTSPAVLAGGLLLLYATCKPFMEIFNAAFSAWLAEG